MVCPKLPPRVPIDARALEMRKSGYAMTNLSGPVKLCLCVCKYAACRRILDDWCTYFNVWKPPETAGLLLHLKLSSDRELML